MIRRVTILLLFLTISQGAALAASPADGFIYGTVTWPSGETLTGFIRWDSEEAFWDDLFHSGYRDNPWLQYTDEDQLRSQRRKEYYAEHGLIDRIIFALNKDDSDDLGWRMFLIRYGDMVSIEIHSGRDDFVVTADGSRHQIGGYANDDGADLLVYTDDPEPRKIEWNDLSGIEFLPVPADAVPYAERLYGLVESTEGSFEGFIQWDVSECLSTDILDGRVQGKEHDVAMGDIRSIARADKQNASVVGLKDGSTQTLAGSNDVERGNRGIMVENPAWGRVVVPWKRFQKVTFSEEHGSGLGRQTYQNSGPLTGTVILKDGQSVSGRLVLDLDESWRWDIFNGSWHDIEYNIPIPLISEITVVDEQTCRVTLRNLQVLELSDNQDTGQKHGGVLVFSTGETQPQHVVWDEVQAIRLDP